MASFAAGSTQSCNFFLASSENPRVEQSDALADMIRKEEFYVRDAFCGTADLRNLLFDMKLDMGDRHRTNHGHYLYAGEEYDSQRARTLKQVRWRVCLFCLRRGTK